MRVAVVGQGYVGLTASTGLAKVGHDVIGVERDPERLAALQSGRPPLFEPGLEELLHEVVGSGQLSFAGSVGDVSDPVDAVAMAVATPPLPSGGSDLSQMSRAMQEILAMSPLPEMIMVKSTIPPGASRQYLAERCETSASLRDRYVYSPEFLSQGTALREWRSPSRVVVGLWNRALLSQVKDLYRGVSGPWVVTSPTNAEMIKYASNAFLATKTSFIDEIANLCERVGAGIEPVIEGMKLDPRIGESYWKVGCGYGDSCLSKDVRALMHWSNAHGYTMRLLEAVEAVNDAQRLKPLWLARQALASAPGPAPVLAVLGLVFEPHSDDMAHAASRVLVPEFVRLASEVRVWDPLLPGSRIATLFPGVSHQPTVEHAVDGAGVVVVLTEFSELTTANWRALAAAITDPRLVIDCKNCLDPGSVTRAGLRYQGIGRTSPDDGLGALPAEELPAAAPVLRPTLHA